MAKKNDDQSVSYLHLLSTGQDVFEDLFEADPDNTGQKVLRKIFAPNVQDKLVLGANISKSFLERVHKSSEQVLMGRNMIAKKDKVLPYSICEKPCLFFNDILMLKQGHFFLVIQAGTLRMLLELFLKTCSIWKIRRRMILLWKMTLKRIIREGR